MRPILRSRRLLAAVAVVGIIAVACSGGGSQGGVDGDVAAGQRDTLLPKDRLELPSFDMDRFQALMDELRGTPVVVNIWASWCGPCRVEAPDLAVLAREFEGDVQFLGIDIIDEREAARDFILEFDWPYPSVFDARGAIRDGLGFIGQPITFIVDQQGEVAFAWNGAVTEDLLRGEIEKVIS